MKELRKAAQEGQATRCLELLNGGLERQSPHLETLSFKYQNGLLDDFNFCEEIDEYINF
jgi:hypothetical protein